VHLALLSTQRCSTFLCCFSVVQGDKRFAEVMGLMGVVGSTLGADPTRLLRLLLFCLHKSPHHAG
jgi:hypothetical protein